ncbi:MAG TPA: pyridoxine 5'-phosphate synthase [Candidatus Binatia bacterium]|nr:pyridoxine 5'-phosphate synthase [Candidatus Binatia bacterium]
MTRLSVNLNKVALLRNSRNIGILRFCRIPEILEVSIGHALVADALEMGFHNAVKAYLQVLATNQ